MFIRAAIYTVFVVLQICLHIQVKHFELHIVCLITHYDGAVMLREEYWNSKMLLRRGFPYTFRIDFPF